MAVHGINENGNYGTGLVGAIFATAAAAMTMIRGCWVSS